MIYLPPLQTIREPGISYLVSTVFNRTVNAAQDLLWNAEFPFLPGPRPLFSTIKKFTFHHNTLHDESAWWLGVWMRFFFRTEGHKESSDDSKRRQDETVRVFLGTLIHHRRMQFFCRPNEFFTSTPEWIATEFSRSVEVSEMCAPCF